MQQVLHNLLSNAIKFTRQGKIQIKGAVHQKLDDPSQLILTVSVSDEGVVYGSCFIRENQKNNIPIAVWGTNPDTPHKDGFLDSEKVNFQYITNGQVYDIDANIREKNRNNGTYIKDDVLVVLDFTTKLR